jgi:hypothetical protein
MSLGLLLSLPASLALVTVLDRFKGNLKLADSENEAARFAVAEEKREGRRNETGTRAVCGVFRRLLLVVGVVGGVF